MAIKKRDEGAAAKKIFSKYGHTCTLDYLPERFEYGNIPKDGLCNRFKRWWIRMTVVSDPVDDVHVHAKHLQSFGAIANERRRQVLMFPNRIHPFSKAKVIQTLLVPAGFTGWSLLQCITLGYPKRTAWAFFMLTMIVLELIATPFEYVLHDLKTSFVYSTLWKVLSQLGNFVLVANVIVTFFIGYYDEPNQEVVLDFVNISKHYAKTLFVFDILSIFPAHWECIIGIEDHTTLTIFHVIGMCRFLLVARYYTFLTLIMVEKYHINFYYYMLTLVSTFTVIFWHITCCMLMFLRIRVAGFVAVHSGTDSTINEHNITLSDHSGIHLLFATYYRGSQIIYNASHGKDLPTSEVEIIVIWFAWYGSLLFFIYILSLIMVIMTAKTSSSHKYAEMERQLKDYMRYKQLPMAMRSRIINYYGFRFQNRYFQESDILATISEQLRQEINLHACRKLVENVIFFRNLPLNLLVRIISCLKIEIYLVNDVIIRANTSGSSMYFISTGTVAVFTKTGKEICHLEDGAHFGEVALIIKNTLRTASVVAVEVSEIYRLDQKDFVKAINPYPDLLANIQRIAAERMEAAEMLDDHHRE